MATVTLGGRPVQLGGKFPAVGDTAPGFKLVRGDLKDVALSDFAGKRKVLNIVPSLDTDICASSARHFNERAGSLDNTVVLVISADTPFAQKRFCETAGLKNVVPLSLMRGREFLNNYGVEILDGAMAGIAARAVVVLNDKDQVIHAQLVPEIATEPNYAAALAALA